VSQFAQVVALLSALGNRRDALLDKVSWQDIADRVSKAEAGQFQVIGGLLKALGDHRGALLEKLDTSFLAGTANRCGRDDLRGLTILMACMDDERRRGLVRGVDWSLLSTKCPLEAGNLQTLGACLENVSKQAEMCSDMSACQKTATYLNGQLDALLCAVRESLNSATKNPMAYAGPAKLLFCCHQIDGELALEIAEQTIGTVVQSFSIFPPTYRYLGQLINAFHEVDPNLAKELLQNKKVRGRITNSLNTQDWAGEHLGARHLIKAIYRASPSTWLKMLSWVAVDLEGLDLESLYAQVKEEAVGSQHVDPG
jgi:hypothetical protein